MQNANIVPDYFNSLLLFSAVKTSVE